MRRVVRDSALLIVLAGLIAPVAGPHFVAAQQKGKGKAAAAATFELYKDKAGEFRFRLKDDEGNLLAISGKGYEKKADCQEAIDTIKRDASKAKVDDQAK
jgi:uncharacterized protein YegP (UPF0339 family)